MGVELNHFPRFEAQTMQWPSGSYRVRDTRKRLRLGIGLVEVLTLICLLGMLLSLVVPAVQASREKARKTSCIAHLQHIGRGLQSHVEAFEYLPSGGGRGSKRTMVDGRPANYKTQQWGWAYQLLPYIEQGAVWEARDYESSRTPIDVYFCPSRRAPTVHLYKALNDYAGIGGGGDKTNALLLLDYKAKPPQRHNGVLVPFVKQFAGQPSGPVRYELITDGLANTMAISEKAMGQRCYSGGGRGDDGSYCNGWILTTIRTLREPSAAYEGRPVKNAQLRPSADLDLGCKRQWDSLGSAHPRAFQALFCDGSVKSLPYETEMAVLIAMASRNDQQEKANNETP